MIEDRKKGKIFYRSVETGALRMNIGPTEMRAVSRSWSWALFSGIMMIIIGVFAVVYPLLSTVGLVIIFGVVLVAAGVVQLVNSFYVRHWESIVWHLVLAFLYAVAGVLLLAYPLGGALTLTALLAVYLALSGIVKILQAMIYRVVGWGWTLASGIISILLAVLVWLAWPTGAFWFIGLVVGLDLIINGLILSAKATTIRTMLIDVEKRTIR